jgi:hypothetical protein
MISGVTMVMMNANSMSPASFTLCIAAVLDRNIAAACVQAMHLHNEAKTFIFQAFCSSVVISQVHSDLQLASTFRSRGLKLVVGTTLPRTPPVSERLSITILDFIHSLILSRFGNPIAALTHFTSVDSLGLPPRHRERSSPHTIVVCGPKVGSTISGL